MFIWAFCLLVRQAAGGAGKVQAYSNLILRYDAFSMRVISNKALADFAADHGDADLPLQLWRKIVESGNFANFADLKRAFNAVDKAGDFYVFDIGGNKFRLITAIHFNRQMVFVRHVFTHKEYDKWKP